MNIHQVLVVDTTVLSCIADSLEERSFSSISPTDYKNTKASIFGGHRDYGRSWSSWVRTACQCVRTELSELSRDVYRHISLSASWC